MIICDDTSAPSLVAGIVDVGAYQTKRTQWYFQGPKQTVTVNVGRSVGLDVCTPSDNALKMRICHDAGLLHEVCESWSKEPFNCRTAPAAEATCLRTIAICRQELASPAPKITTPPPIPLTFCHDAKRDFGHTLLYCRDNAPSSPGGLGVYKDDNGRFQMFFGTGGSRYTSPTPCDPSYLDDPFTPCGRAKDAANGISEPDRAELARQSIEKIRKSSDELPPEYTGRWGFICLGIPRQSKTFDPCRQDPTGVEQLIDPLIVGEYNYGKTTLTTGTHNKDGQVVKDTWELDIHKAADGYLVTEVYPVGWPKAGQKDDVTKKIYLTHSDDGRDFLRSERQAPVGKIVDVYCRLAEGLPLRCKPPKPRQALPPASR